MWIRKSPSQIEYIERRKARNRSRFNPKAPLMLAAILATGVFLRGYLGIGHSIDPRLSIWSPTARQLGMILKLFFGILGGTYALQIILGGSRPFGAAREKKMMICPKCSTVQSNTPSGRCLCGEGLEPLENWTWIKQEDFLEQ